MVGKKSAMFPSNTSMMLVFDACDFQTCQLLIPQLPSPASKLWNLVTPEVV